MRCVRCNHATLEFIPAYRMYACPCCMKIQKGDKNKYNAMRTDGFSSRGESDCHHYLKMLEDAGEIKILKRQPQVYMTKAQIGYKPDFLIEDLKTGRKVWIEFKGFETNEYQIKLKLWKHYGPGTLRVYKGAGLRMEIVKEVRPTDANDSNDGKPLAPDHT